MNINMATKLSSLHRFTAFWVIFCARFLFIIFFALYVGGGGHSRVSEEPYLSLTQLLPSSWDPVCLVQTPFWAGVRPPQKIGKNLPKTRKNGPKMGKNWLWGHFSYFSANFSLFSGGGRNLYIFLFFSHFGPEARNGFCTRQTGTLALQ